MWLTGLWLTGLWLTGLWSITPTFVDKSKQCLSPCRLVARPDPARFPPCTYSP